MVASPSLVLNCDPKGPQFAILEDCEMPKITVTANFENFTPDPKAPVFCQWKVNVLFRGGPACAHSGGRVIRHSEIAQVTSTNTFAIPSKKFAVAI